MKSITACTMAGALALGVLTGIGSTTAAATGLRCQIGLLTEATLAGNNPATGEPWKVGDPYRFAFHTNSETGSVTGNESSDITYYDGFVQGLANASEAYPISEDDGVTWKVIGSTSTVDARDHTHTNPNVETGNAIYLLNGSTLVAKDNAQLWSGTIQNIINITDRGETWAHWPYTGTMNDGTKRTGGSNNGPLGPGTTGQGNAGTASQWVWRTWTGRNGDLLPLYALSDPLTIQAPPGTIISIR